MGQICPRCQYESSIVSDYCPSCGAPMNEHVYSGQLKRARMAESNAALLPLKWHKFLMYFSLPVSILMGLIALIGTHIPAVRDFDPALYKEGYQELMLFSYQLSLWVQVLLLPGLIAAEIGLVKKKWFGVYALGFVYLVQFFYAGANLYILARANITDVTTIVSAIEMLLLFILTQVYYRKRRGLFS